MKLFDLIEQKNTVADKPKEEFDSKTYFEALLPTGVLTANEKEMYLQAIPGFEKLLDKAIVDKVITPSYGYYQLTHLMTNPEVVQKVDTSKVDSWKNYVWKEINFDADPIRKPIANFDERFAKVQKLREETMNETIQLDKVTKVIDVSKMIKSHFVMLDDKPTIYQEPYLKRLEQLQNILESRLCQ